jgi:hypothetical protein
MAFPGYRERTDLVGWNDWASLRYTFHNTFGFVDGDRTTRSPEEEIDFATYAETVRANLAVRATAPPTAAPGSTVTLRFEVTNRHPEAARLAQVALALPPGLTHLHRHPPRHLHHRRRPRRHPPWLPGGDTALITVAATVACTVPQGTRLQPEAQAILNTTDPDPRDNTAPAPLEVRGPPSTAPDPRRGSNHVASAEASGRAALTGRAADPRRGSGMILAMASPRPQPGDLASVTRASLPEGSKELRPGPPGRRVRLSAPSFGFSTEVAPRATEPIDNTLGPVLRRTRGDLAQVFQGQKMSGLTGGLLIGLSSAVTMAVAEFGEIPRGLLRTAIVTAPAWSTCLWLAVKAWRERRRFTRTALLGQLSAPGLVPAATPIRLVGVIEPCGALFHALGRRARWFMPGRCSPKRAAAIGRAEPPGRRSGPSPSGSVWTRARR